MSPNFRFFLIGVCLVFLLALALGGCARQVPAAPTLTIEPDPQSWDQANLKRHDSGCPTAIYIAPKGVLEQCEP